MISVNLVVLSTLNTCKYVNVNINLYTKIVSMIRKYHNQKPQANPWCREEEPHNHHETPGRKTKQNNLLSLPHQDDCKTRMDIN